MAVHANDVLAHAKIFATLGDAVEDCHLTVGTTCRGGPYREAMRPLRETAIDLAETSATNRIAMIFGTEDTGLTNQELKFCQRAHHDSDLRRVCLHQSSAVGVAVRIRTADGACRRSAGSARASTTRERGRRRCRDGAFERIVPRDRISARGKSRPPHVHPARNLCPQRAGPRELEIINGIAKHTKWAAEGGHETLAAKRAAGKKLR